MLFSRTVAVSLHFLVDLLEDKFKTFFLNFSQGEKKAFVSVFKSFDQSYYIISQTVYQVQL